MKGKAIIEEAKDTIFDVKDTAKEKVKNATGAVKKLLVGNEKEVKEAKQLISEEADASVERHTKVIDTVKDKIEKAKDTVADTYEGAKEKLNLKNNYEQLDTFEQFDGFEPIAAQKESIFNKIFHPRKTYQVFPVVYNNFRKILK